jgi:lysophospholipase L1-like esterase
MDGHVSYKGKMLGAGASLALVLALVACLRFAAPAPAADAPSLLGVNVAKGHVNLGMLAPPNSAVTFYEIVDGTKVELGEAVTLTPKVEGANGIASIPAVPWVCGRPVRHFVGEAHTPDGRTVEASNDARTPDCRDRIALIAPSRVEPGARVPITLKDRWQVGDLRVRLCVARKGTRRCSSMQFAEGQKALSFKRNAGAGVGLLDLDLQVAGFRRHQKVGVGRAVPVDANRPVALVTGDSMMEGIDAILAQQLKARYRVIGQTRPGTGVSKDLGKPWTTVAREQAGKQKPALTVVLLGGNDGFPMEVASGEKVPCCGEAWRQEYLSRITQMAEAWLRGGRSTLVWALLPPPRRDDLVEQMSAVNDAIRRLAATLPQIQLVGLDELFGPQYRETVNGQKVRDPDGLHLSLPGQRIAAKAIVAAIRAAGAVTK